MLRRAKLRDALGNEEEQRTGNDEGTVARLPVSNTSWWKIWSSPSPRHRALSEGLPLADASMFSMLTYSWLNPIMHVGRVRMLEASDLWKVDRKWSAAYLSSQLDQAWERQQFEALSFNSTLGRGGVRPGALHSLWWKSQTAFTSKSYSELEAKWRNDTGKKTPSLSKALNEVAGSFFWIGGACKVFADICQMMGPILIKAIINFAKERSNAKALGHAEPHIVKGILLALGLYLLAMTTSLSHHQFFWRSIVTGVLSRTALTSSIYRRTVNLTARSKTTLSNATIINHISTDISRVEACAQWFHPVWASPVQVLICLIILLVHLGPSALTGFALFLLVIPLQKRLVGRQFHIRKRLGKLTLLRTKSLLEAIGSMHFIKCYTLELPFFRHISALRRAELAGVKEIQNYQSANAALAFSLPILAATLAFTTYSSSGDFDLAVVFASLSLFQLLRQPMTFWPRALSLTTDARNSLNKLSSIYLAESSPGRSLTINHDQRSAISVDHVTLKWEECRQADSVAGATKLENTKSTRSDATRPFTLQSLNIQVPRGSLVAIIGPVASGKSSLLQGLLGEMTKISGTISFCGNVAYCPQIPWLQKGTIRDNILFGQIYHEKRYQQVLKDVSLLEEIGDMSDGDLTQLGENGANVSGGQRQRIGLARALYLNSDIIFLDDPLSGVDPHVGKHMLQRAILAPVKSGKTVVSVTYDRNLLSHCDYIYHLHDGRIVEQGTFEELLSKNALWSGSYLEPEATAVQHEAGHSPEALDRRPPLPSKSATTGNQTAATNPPCAKSGRLSRQAFRTYFIAAHGFMAMPSLILATILMQGSQILSSRNLVWWQSNAFTRSFQFYQALYGTFGILQTLSTFFLGKTVDSISCLVSQNMHNQALRNILHAPMSFFESTVRRYTMIIEDTRSKDTSKPRGSILSLFGKDIDSIDNQLPASIRTLCLTVGTVLGSTTVIVLVQPYLIVVAIMVFAGYQHFSRIYRTTARQVKRIESSLRSDVYAHFAESLNGLQTLRSYGQIERAIHETDFLLDAQNRASFVSATNQRWLSVRLDFCGSLLVFSVALCAVLGIGSIGAAKIGLILTYTTTLTQMCGLLTRQIADVEIHMNSIERLSYYHDQDAFIQESQSAVADETKPPANWPEHGAISLRGVSVRYRPGLPDVLQNITADIKAGERLGIVGRTGVGKSSLMNCLMRIVNYSGTITIDGVDISTIGLKCLRSKLSFVPQEPVVFGGTVRSALDPHAQYEDKTLRDALHRAFAQIGPKESDMKTPLRRLDLDTAIETQGINLSIGERALLNLARVLVRNSRIVVLDEATASVDQDTDEIVQKAIHHEFRDRTLLCIAHRIRTVLSYDRILVLDGGRIVELDTPRNLFEKTGFFYQLCLESHITREDIVLAKWTSERNVQ